MLSELSKSTDQFLDEVAVGDEAAAGRPVTGGALQLASAGRGAGRRQRQVVALGQADLFWKTRQEESIASMSLSSSSSSWQSRKWATDFAQGGEHLGRKAGRVLDAQRPAGLAQSAGRKTLFQFLDVEGRAQRRHGLHDVRNLRATKLSSIVAR